MLHLANFLFVANSNPIDPVVARAFEEVPKWLQEYAKWHDEKRRNLKPNSPTKIMVLTCFDNKRQCGGISDRLGAVPYFLRVAAKTNRLFFIKWNKFDLEDFLVPPSGGIDWRLPDNIDIGQDYNADIDTLFALNEDPSSNLNKKRMLVLPKVQHTPVYENLPDFTTVAKPEGTYREIWDICFKPVPPLEELINKTMKKLGLVPKQYVSAQIRTMPDVVYRSHNDLKLDPATGHYVHKEGGYEPLLSSSLDEKTKQQIMNGINCAVQIAGDKSLPVYITSSNSINIKYALTESPYAQQNRKNKSPIKIVGEHHPRVHTEKLAREKNWKEMDPRMLYPAFVDLYILGNSKCVSYGRLGFGNNGARLAGNKCKIDTRRNRNCTNPL